MTSELGRGHRFIRQRIFDTAREGPRVPIGISCTAFMYATVSGLVGYGDARSEGSGSLTVTSTGKPPPGHRQALDPSP